MSDEIPKLRLAADVPAFEAPMNLEREKLTIQQLREGDLEDSLAPFRVGSVPYLNSVPLTRGLEKEICFLPPSQLAELLRKGELDAALLSITEVLHHDLYDVLDGIAIASLGEVQSVFLAHRCPLEDVREVYCDPASLTSVNLLKVLLAERGIKAEFRQLEDYSKAAACDAVLLIGNPAIEFRRSNPPHSIWDLGAAWYEMTDLPFVYAVWALRRGVENSRLRRQLREAKDFGLDTLEYIIGSRGEFDYNFRKDYLGWHIHYHLGADEKRGIRLFVEMLRKHGLGPVYDPKFVT